MNTRAAYATGENRARPTQWAMIRVRTRPHINLRSLHAACGWPKPMPALPHRTRRAAYPMDEHGVLPTQGEMNTRADYTIGARADEDVCAPNWAFAQSIWCVYTIRYYSNFE